MQEARSLVLDRQRNLKWRALDPLESVLMMLCGFTLAGFCTSVVCDIVTRTIGAPWLWLQEVTSTFFIYGIFIGAAVATNGGVEAGACGTTGPTSTTRTSSANAAKPAVSWPDASTT